MSDQQSWQENNTRYLSTALIWLRLHLEKLTSQHLAVNIPPQQQAQEANIDEKWQQKTAEMAALKSQDQTLPALLILSQRLGLTRFEQELLLLCIAMELDTRIASLCARAQDNPNKPYPTFALALALFDNPAWDVLSPERPLRYWRLIEINQPGAQPLTTSPLRADERIVNYIKGLNYLDDRLSSLLAPLDIDEQQTEIPPSQHPRASWKISYVTGKGLPLSPLLTSHRSPSSNWLVPTNPASKRSPTMPAQLGRHLYRLPVELLPSQAGDREMLARLWERENLLLPLALYLDRQDADNVVAGEGQAPLLALPINHFLARSEGIFFLGTRQIESRLGRSTLAFDVAKPTVEEQQYAWSTELGEAATDNAGILASQFNLNLSTIHRIAHAALVDRVATSLGDPLQTPPLSEQLWHACLLNSRPGLDALAQRLIPKATWDDLVLPVEETNTLHQLADQVQQRNKVYEEWGFARKINRGLGINALFAGESGTGKTMAAEVIANGLRLNLYRIDLSAVVSKYIGETEKNLRRLFDAAEDGGAILFFDEADALFGKRSEVKDSHDRYANIEINYLLQRMEAYRGLAILATNMLSALDTAFLRRLRFVIKFPFPALAERKRMWQKAFPTDTPTQDLDYDRLARFTLTGGSIHNVALNSAFMAARTATPVTMPLILTAARSELRKLDRPILEADFKWHPPLSVPQEVNI